MKTLEEIKITPMCDLNDEELEILALHYNEKRKDPDNRAASTIFNVLLAHHMPEKPR